MELEIISPENIVFKGEASEITMPGTLGIFTVLPHHAALISSLKEGDIIYKTTEGEKKMEIYSGFAEVRDNKVSVCVEIK